MIRKIIKINEEKCNGCGLCATACHEGAIEMAHGKAKLVKENFCDGFGDCLPNCPTGAITFEEREAPAYDEEAVRKAKESSSGGTANNSDINGKEKEGAVMNNEHKEALKAMMNGGHGCPGSAAMDLGSRSQGSQDGYGAEKAQSVDYGYKPVARLGQWPCQIKLVPAEAPFFDGAKLLIAADCTAYAYANMHEDFMKGKVTLIGCPKLDAVDYSDKLTEIIKNNDIKSVTIVRMEVPCCGGLQVAAQNALQASGKFIPWQVVTISRDGRILED